MQKPAATNKNNENETRAAFVPHMPDLFSKQKLWQNETR